MNPTHAVGFFLRLFHKVLARAVCSSDEFGYDAKVGRCAAWVVVLVYKRRNLID